MKLSVRLFAGLKDRAGRSEIEIAGLEDGLDVAALKREIERMHPALGSLAAVRAAVGTEYVAESRKLADGEILALIPPVSGGSGAMDGGESSVRLRPSIRRPATARATPRGTIAPSPGRRADRPREARLRLIRGLQAMTGAG
jgi:molybdopterin converting factor small subunit